MKKSIIQPIIASRSMRVRRPHEGYSDDPDTFGGPAHRPECWQSDKWSQVDVDAAHDRVTAMVARLTGIARAGGITAARQEMDNYSLTECEADVAKYGLTWASYTADMYVPTDDPEAIAAWVIRTHTRIGTGERARALDASIGEACSGGAAF